MERTLYNHTHEEGKCEHAPIRGSMVILVAKLLVIFVFFELLYAGIYYVFTLGISLPFDLHHHVTLAIFILEIVKILTQVYLVITVALLWANNTFYIDGENLIKKTGIINIKEDMYELNTVRSMTVDQSWLGRIFHYGDITLKTSASGGYQVIVTIDGIQTPQKYKQMIKQCL